MTFVCLGLLLVSFVAHVLRVPPRENIAGAALDGRTVVTWGDRVLRWEPAGGTFAVLAPRGKERLGAAGALWDANRDGRIDLVLERAGELLWLEAPRWTSHTIDRGITTPDILPAVLHGRRGVLIVQQHMQVRFYEAPKRPGARWPERDIYSFYTPSQEAGLLLHDVDGDGLPDIFCGNYWIRSPERFELSWRLFAINLYNETPEAANDRLALADLAGKGIPALIVSEAEVSGARLAWFEKPPDPKQPWLEHRLEGSLRLEKPRALTVADFDGDGALDLAVGENNGPRSRLMIFWNRGGGRFESDEAGRAAGMHTAFSVDVNGDGRPDIVTAGSGSVVWWENAGRHRLRAASPRARAKTRPRPSYLREPPRGEGPGAGSAAPGPLRATFHRPR